MARVPDLRPKLSQNVLDLDQVRELLPFDVPRGRRKLSRYLGPDESRWDPRFVQYLHGDHEHRGTRWLRIRPERLTAQALRCPPSRANSTTSRQTQVTSRSVV